jgi:hypothetical protein
MEASLNEVKRLMESRNYHEYGFPTVGRWDVPWCDFGVVKKLLPGLCELFRGERQYYVTDPLNRMERFFVHRICDKVGSLAVVRGNRCNRIHEQMRYNDYDEEYQPPFKYRLYELIVALK